jgi:hypothetical protein
MQVGKEQTDRKAVPAETRSIYWGSREPQTPCHDCGFPYQLHHSDCPKLNANSAGMRNVQV